MNRAILIAGLLTAVITGTGCSLAPRSFRSMVHTSPIVRARAVDLGKDQPEYIAVPAMIDRLADKDPAVRLTAHETLKERTRRDFGYVSWAPEGERVKAVERWRKWWTDRAAQAGYPKPDESAKVTTRPGRGRRAANATAAGQGGPTTSWPANPPDSASNP